MHEVTEKEFWAFIYDNKLDVHPRPIGSYPYASIFEYRDRREMGRIVPNSADKCPETSKYFLVDRD